MEMQGRKVDEKKMMLGAVLRKEVEMIPDILQRAEREGYVVFKTGSYNLNLIGVRSPESTANAFDDTLHCVYKDSAGKWVELSFPVTTDPGKYWLVNPSRVSGTAILCPGQYRGTWQLGKHKGQYEALVQTGGQVKVYRDADKDEILEHNPEDIEQGYFGINIHRASSVRTSTQVDKWSAGCQVFADPNDYRVFMELCRISADLYGNSFSYTLLED